MHLGLKDATNAPTSPAELRRRTDREGIAYRASAWRAGADGAEHLADALDPRPWFAAADKAAELGADALIVADTAVMGHCARVICRALRLPPVGAGLDHQPC